MEAKSALNFVMKSWRVCILLTTAAAMTTMGSLSQRKSIQHNTYQHHVNNLVNSNVVNQISTQLAESNSTRSEVIGTEIKLHCPQKRNGLIVWKATLRNGTDCYLSYYSISNNSYRNCSSMNWLSSPDQESTLHIKPLHLVNEGIYVCSVAMSNGTFSHQYTLTILVPPQVSLIYHDSSGTAVCKAAAGKPAAQISWTPQGVYNTLNETLLNGTQTITSTYNISSAKDNTVTCFISHLAGNKSLVLNLPTGSEKRKSFIMKSFYSSLAGLLGILLLSLFIYLGRLLYGRHREVSTPKSPETISRLSIQENEMEPYATFVQKENVIYDRTCDFLPGLSPSALQAT